MHADCRGRASVHRPNLDEKKKGEEDFFLAAEIYGNDRTCIGQRIFGCSVCCDQPQRHVFLDERQDEHG